METKGGEGGGGEIPMEIKDRENRKGQFGKNIQSRNCGNSGHKQHRPKNKA